MRRLVGLAACVVLSGCATAASVPTAEAPATAAPVAARSCEADATFDSAGRFNWSGTTYAPLGQTSLHHADTAGLLLGIGCDGAKAYGLRGMRPECEVVVLNTDAWDAYAPTPLPSGCPAPVTSPGGHIAELPASLSDCPTVPEQPLGRGTSESMGDVIRVGPADFVAESPPRTTVSVDDLGGVQFTVRCSYSALNTLTRQETPELRSHDSTFVPAGQPVYALKGWPPSCRLAAQHDDEWHVYLHPDQACTQASPS